MFRPLSRLWRPFDVERGYCRRCRKPKVDPRARGLILGCCCQTCLTCTNFPRTVTVTVSGITACDYCNDGGHGVRIYGLTGQNSTFVLPHIGSGQYLLGWESSGVMGFEDGSSFDSPASACPPNTPFCTHTFRFNVRATLSCNGSLGFSASAQITDGYLEEVANCESGSGGSVSPLVFSSANVVAKGGTAANIAVPCQTGSSGLVQFGSGGTATIDWDFPSVCCECSFCETCGANAVDCPTADCCTPSTIRATVSSVTTALGTCILGSGGVSAYKVDGTTAVNRTIDLVQNPINTCIWDSFVYADWVIRKYSSLANCTGGGAPDLTTSILFIRYRLERTGSTTWTWRVDGLNQFGAVVVNIVGAAPSLGTCTINPMSITASANNCSTVSSASHPVRTACVNDGSFTGIVGSSGSTSFSVCP